MLPALRNVDVTQIVHEGQPYVCLNDVEGVVESQIMLSLQAFFIAAQLDGLTTTEEIQQRFQDQFGIAVQDEEVDKVVTFLDESGLLETERFHELRDTQLRTFAQSPVCPAYHAGRSYPEDPEELRAYLDSLFTREGGPGEAPAETPGAGPAPRCVVAPHIDFDRGGACYAHTYLRWHQQGRPTTVFVFGVSHAGGGPFLLTKKDFQTPFGVVKTDRDAVERLEHAAQWDPYEDEILFRTEHSIEFQIVMLSYLFGTSINVVPVLCGCIGDGWVEGDDPLAGVEGFLDACRDLVASREGATVLAAADLAHVGPRFGDAFAITNDVLRRVRDRDAADLARALAMDAQGFYDSVMADDNERRVCGLNAVYAALRATPGTPVSGLLADYGMASDPAGGIVSFAGLVFP
jgi:hypothetical protein